MNRVLVVVVALAVGVVLRVPFKRLVRRWILRPHTGDSSADALPATVPPPPDRERPIAWAAETGPSHASPDLPKRPRTVSRDPSR